MMKKSAWQKEMDAIIKKRNQHIKTHSKKKEITPALMAKVPDKLRSTLNAAFIKAFQIIFDKGAAIIEKTYAKENAEQQHQINQYAVGLKKDRKSYKLFSRQSDKANAINLLVSGIEGLGLGLVGCGIPDIPLFTSVILRNLYEISVNYGYDYTFPEEKYYQLLIIKGAFVYREELKKCIDELDSYTNAFVMPTKEDIDELIKSTASALADEMLFLKFVQSIPIVGVIGGASNTVFLRRIQKFAKINYQYRMLKRVE